MSAEETAEPLFEIDALCEQFEDEVRAERTPRIEQYLQQAPAALTSLLFRHLLTLEWDYSRRQKQSVAPTLEAGYYQRFPDFGEIIDEVVGRNAATKPISPRPTDGANNLAGRSFGPYTLLRPLGRGGMGEVFLARHEGLRRLAAIKLVQTELRASPEVLARFRTEAKTLARLTHPNIVQVFDAGECDGLAYLALEYMAGGTLAQRLDGKPWPQKQAAELGESLARGVAAAHDRGIVHRDLKPANILFEGASGERPGASEEVPSSSATGHLPAATTPKIADFGLAKILEASGEQTASGLFLGTATYCSPEQAAGHAKKVGPLSDVFSLGVILYELLTGVSPFRGVTILETLSQVMHQEPVAPRLLIPSLDRDLDTICLRCLEKDPARRYVSATALANDLRRFLDGQPILARPVSPLGRLARWARRNPGLAASLTVLILVLLTTTATALFAADRFRHLAASEAQQRNEAEKAQEQTRRHLYFSQMLTASRVAESHSGIVRLRDLVEEWQPRKGKPDLRGWEWRHFRALSTAEDRVLATNPAGYALDWSPDGERLAVGQERCVTILRLPSGELIGEVANLPRITWSTRWSPDGRRLAVPADQQILLVDSRTGQTLHALAVDTPTREVFWHPNGARLFFVDEAMSVHTWDVGETRHAVAIPGFKANQYTRGNLLSPDGQRLALPGQEDFVLTVVEVETGKAVHRFESQRAGFTSVAWRRDGQQLAAATNTGRILAWDVRSGQVVWSRPPDGSHTPVLAWSPDGTRLAWANWNHVVRVWNTETNEEVALLRGHEGGVHSLAWSPDGRQLASTGSDGSVRFWNMSRPPASWTRDLHSREESPNYLSVAWSRSGSRLAASSQGLGTVLWDANRGERIGEVRGVCCAWDSREESLAVVFGESVFLWTANGREKLSSVEIRGQPKQLAWHPRQRRLAIRAADRVWLWDAKSDQPPTQIWGEPLKERDIPYLPSGNLAWHPDGERLAFGDHKGRQWFVFLWDVRTGSVAREVEVGSDRIDAIAWTADGRFLAVAEEKAIIRIFDTQTWEETLPLRGHVFRIRDLAWHPDGTRLASVSEDGSVRVWDPRAGEVAFQTELGCITRSVAWSHDGNKLATLGANGLLHVWDATGAGERGR